MTDRETDRKNRLAEALRENLRKRKAQLREGKRAPADDKKPAES